MIIIKLFVTTTWWSSDCCFLVPVNPYRPTIIFAGGKEMRYETFAIFDQSVNV